MKRSTKWIAVGVLVAIPTIGFAVTKLRHHHGGCPNKTDCPLKRAK